MFTVWRMLFWELSGSLSGTHTSRSRSWAPTSAPLRKLQLDGAEVVRCCAFHEQVPPCYINASKRPDGRVSSKLAPRNQPSNPVASPVTRSEGLLPHSAERLALRDGRGALVDLVDRALGASRMAGFIYRPADMFNR